MPIKQSIQKYDRICPDLFIDGCGSMCDSCSGQEFCGGCNQCEKLNCSSATCTDCEVRCWRINNLPDWLKDINGLSIDNLSCQNTFKENLPAYIPQLKNSAFMTDHPAYIINIERLLIPKTLRWGFRQRGSIRKCFKIPDASKLILSFCTKDATLERIWKFSESWQDQQSFWDGVAYYAEHQGLTASFSVEFSCYSNAPRLDHLINIKRNIISAHELSKRGIPIILDAIVRTDADLIRLTQWGKKNDIKWYVLNFQRLRRTQWLLALIEKRIEIVIGAGGNAIISGIAAPDIASFLINKYGDRISITNTVVSESAVFFTALNEQGKREKSTLPKSEHQALFQNNLKNYCSASGLTRGLIL